MCGIFSFAGELDIIKSAIRGKCGMHGRWNIGLRFAAVRNQERPGSDSAHESGITTAQIQADDGKSSTAETIRLAKLQGGQ